jgi:uncharacterized repeat protein (TIGR03943 family)
MRFKLPIKEKNIVLLIVSSYVLYLGVNSQLNLYIHPRYIVFTFLLSAVGLIITLMDTFYNKNINIHEHNKTKNIYKLPLYFIIVLALLIPAKSLTSATVSQRSTDSGSIVTTSESKPVGALFSESSKGLSISDWSRILGSNTNADFYKNKPVSISGFIFDGDLGPDKLLLARFVVTCCAVDAIPVTVPAQIKDWRNIYQENDWIEIEGNFRSIESNGLEQIILVPETVNKIEEPSNPYAN